MRSAGKDGGVGRRGECSVSIDCHGLKCVGVQSLRNESPNYITWTGTVRELAEALGTAVVSRQPPLPSSMFGYPAIPQTTVHPWLPRALP